MKKLVTLALALVLALSATAAKKVTRVSCVGNSITYGYKIPDREVNSYPAQLQKMLGDKFEVGNFGHSGTTLLRHGHNPYYKNIEFQQAMDFKGDIAVIHLGINDTDPRDWPNYRDEFINDYLWLVDQLKIANPECRIILCLLSPIGITHHRFESGTSLWLREIRDEIAHIACLLDVETIDLWDVLQSYDHLMPDALHPNAEGAGLLAKAVYKQITGDYGGLQMPMLYTDSMVLPHGKAFEISGTANALEDVTVSIAGQTQKVVTDLNGKWSVDIQPLKAGGPYTLDIKAKSRSLKYKNVLAGEIWLCSGQSNMEFTLNRSKDAKTDIPKAKDSQMRFFDMKLAHVTYEVQWEKSYLDSLNHLKGYLETQWSECTPETAAQFSAIGYYFGRELRDSLNVPIGLICNAVGGSNTESWISRDVLETKFPAILRNWTHNDFIQDWCRNRAIKNMGVDDASQRHPYQPTYLFDTGILPLEHFPIDGVIWYQGESNAHNFEAHEKLFTLMVECWRDYWKKPNLPVLTVQLSSIARPSWPWFRDSQRRLAKRIPGVQMAVSSDYGDSLDVHPREKEPIGNRLARLALNKVYMMRHVTPAGPMFRSVEFDGTAAYVNFENAKGMRSSDGKALRTFEIAGADKIFYPATATVEGDRIKLTSPDVSAPAIVRYGWQPFTRANLVNGEGLPASTFRSDL